VSASGGPDRLGQNLSLGKHTHVPYGMQQDAVATMHRRWPRPFVRPGHQLKWSQQIAEKLVRPVVSDWSRTVAERFQPSLRANGEGGPESRSRCVAFASAAARHAVSTEQQCGKDPDELKSRPT
jgi:hypothetical protein